MAIDNEEVEEEETEEAEEVAGTDEAVSDAEEEPEELLTLPVEPEIIEDEETIEIKPAEPTLATEIQTVLKQTSMESKSYKEILKEQYEKSVKNAFAKAEKARKEKEKEMSSFIKQNEKMQEVFKELWTKSGKENIQGYFAKIELFSQCKVTLEEQLEILKGKKIINENHYAELLDLAGKILVVLSNEQANYQIVNNDGLADVIEKGDAHKRFIRMYYEHREFMNRFIINALSGTVITTERWRGKEEIIGKPRNY